MDLARIIPSLQAKLDAENLQDLHFGINNHPHHRVKYFGDLPQSSHHVESESHSNMAYHQLPLHDGHSVGDVGDLSTSFPVNVTPTSFYHHFARASATIPGIIGLDQSDNVNQFLGKMGLAGDDVVSEPTNQDSSYPTFDGIPLRLPIWGIVILIIAYASVFICGVIGNSSVLFVVIRMRRMKTLVNLFILNLAVADLLVLVFCLLPNLVSNIFVPWVLGSYLCKGVAFIQGVCVCASVYTLLTISVERCISIQWPFKYLFTRDRAKLIILFIWIWSSLVALPWALFFQSGNFDEENPDLEFCIEVWPEEYEHWGRYYFLFGNLILCYLFPLTVILISYLTIWFRVYRREIPSDSYHTAMELMHQKSKSQVLKMICFVVLIFFFSWLPLMIIVCRIKFGPQEMSELESTVISIVYPIAQWMICSNSCSNAVIYSFLNRKFLQAFKSMIGNWRKRKIRIKHKSPTVNILLKRFSTYRVETTVSNNNNNNYGDDSSEQI